ncbi:glycine receptor subunit alpha-2-like [Dermacentor albipictus]|uniref:glycine receptor subunit alpha-2-like n=1 Tax=Dermacentor albipictus TaxID=60249 RepID=UPI0031FC4482
MRRRTWGRWRHLKGYEGLAAVVHLHRRQLCAAALPYITRPGSVSYDALNFHQLPDLDELFEGYDKRAWPTYGTGEPTKVLVDMRVNTLGPMNAEDMDYEMDIFFRQAWRDPRISLRRFGHIDNLTVNGAALLGRMWKPDLYFVNAKEVRTHTVTMPNQLLRLSPDGDVLVSIRLSLRLSCLMFFYYFPFDKQRCFAQLRPYINTLSQVEFIWREGHPVHLVGPIHMQDFNLEEMSHENYTIELEKGSFSCLQVTFLLERQQGFHMIQTYLPIYILVFVSWLSAWMRPDVIPPRAIIGVNTLLTMASIYLSLSTHLPNVAYNKAVDVWLVACILLIIGALIEFGIANYLFRSRLTRAEFLQALSVFKKDKLPRDPSGLPLNQKRAFTVERYSRAMFPLLFLALNIVYWSVYLSRPLVEADTI